MKSALCLALLVACLIMVAFSERMGLPGPLASELVRGLIALCCIALAMVSATSRLMHFLDGDRPGLAFGRLAIQSSLLMGALPLFPSLSLNEPAAALTLVSGYFLTMLLLPARRLATLGPEADRPFNDGADRALVLGFGTGLAAFGLLLIIIEPLTRDFARILGLDTSIVARPFLAFLVILVIFGGASALSRLSRAVIVLATLFVVMPFGTEFLLDRSLAPAEQWRDMVAGVENVAMPWVQRAISGAYLEAFVSGVALGLVGLASMPGTVGPLRRGGYALVAIAITSLFALFFAAEMMRLDGILRDTLQKSMPTAWPLFTFDEAVRGWLKTCGVIPSDAVDVLQACRRLGLGGMVPPEHLQVDTSMAGPVLAVSRGWPAIFGLIWNLLPLLTALIFVAMLLHVASAALSETVMFRLLRPRLLRAGRLASARLAMIATALMVSSINLPVPPRFLFWLFLGCSVLAAIIWVTDRLLAFCRWVRRSLKRRPPVPRVVPIPANDDEPASLPNPVST
jgi:hypothetical protein